MQISVSRLRTYLLCAKQYQFRYVENEPPEFTSINLAFGGAMHHCIAAFHESKNTLEPSAMFAEFNKYFQAMIDESEGDGRELRFKADSDEALRQKAHALCKQYVEVFSSVVPESADHVELWFEVPLFDPQSGLGSLEHTLVGRIDLVADRSVYEFKTSSRSASQLDADRSLQLAAYSLAYQYLFDEPPENLKLVTLTTAKAPKISILQTQRWYKDHQAIVEMGIQIARAVEAGIFFRNREYQYGCANCEYEQRCLGFQPQKE